MSKITLTNLANLDNPTTACALINANMSVIQAAIDNTLSRDGTTPNYMVSNLDMNSNRIVNLAAPVNNSDAVRLIDIGNAPSYAAAALASQNAAAASAAAAATSATNAATSESNAQTYMLNAATSAGAAATSASNAANAVQLAAGTATPLMDGSAAVGVGTKWSREDHVHPSDTSRAALAGNNTFAGTNTFSSTVTHNGTVTNNATSVIASSMEWTSVISPASLSTNQNDYNPTGLSTATLIRLTSSVAVTITGLTAQAGGYVVGIMNTGSNTITLSNQNASSAAANRFNFGTDTILNSGQTSLVWYDATSTCWRPLAGSGSGGSAFIQDAAPTTGLQNGSLWWQSSTGTLYVYYNDGTSSQWVSTNPAALPQAAVQYDVSQGLSSTQQTQALKNIGVASILKGTLFGCTLSTAGASSTFSVAAGGAIDSTGADYMALASAMSKTTGAWAVGTGNGALDIGTIQATKWYHVYLIKRTDTGVVDALISQQPNLSSTVTISIATPGVITWNNHGLQGGAAVVFTTTGALPTGITAGTTYYVQSVLTNSTFQIAATQGGAAIATSGTQSGVHTATSAPVLPTNYTLSRRIGSMLTNGLSQWTLFHQLGDEFIWDVTVVDVNSAVISTRTLSTLTIPTGVQVNALFRASVTSATVQALVTFFSPDESDQAASGAAAGFELIVQVTNQFQAGRFNVRSNTSGQIASRGSGSPALIVSTYGWIDTRGKLY